MGSFDMEKQKKQYYKLVQSAAEYAIKETDLDKEGIQKLIENGDAFQARIVMAVREFSVNKQYADEFACEFQLRIMTKVRELPVGNHYIAEEMESNYGYLSGYKPKSITEQTNRLRELFPKIGYADEKLAEQNLPPDAEGWFAIPRWEKIAPTYSEAVLKVFDIIDQTRNGGFYNHLGDLDIRRYLHHSQKSVKALLKLEDEQKDHDILVVPAQFGFRHRGRSVRRAREVMNANEFGLGAFAIGIMILTHQERLQHDDDLGINCAGDDSTGVPYFAFVRGNIIFDTWSVEDVISGFGSASGFMV